jgi:Anticodon binding domain
MVIKSIGKEVNQPSKIVMQVLRYSIAGLESGVGVPTIIHILGTQKVQERLEICRSQST